MENRTVLIKEKILSFLNRNGPNFPVFIAKEIGTDMLFASAFLSELISNQKVKTSNMKVGTSSIYFLPGQEKELEKFSEYLKGKEREAQILLKRNKFLVDSKQDAPIQVALRAIKDFAKPFDKKGKLISLRERLKRVAEHMEKNGMANKNELKGLRVLTQAKDSLYSVDTFNDYVHNRHFSPVSKDLKINWDNVQVFMEKLWSNV